MVVLTLASVRLLTCCPRNNTNYKYKIKDPHCSVIYILNIMYGTYIMRTDNSSVSWLQKTPEPLGQNARWLEQLGEFSFIIIIIIIFNVA